MKLLTKLLKKKVTVKVLNPKTPEEWKSIVSQNDAVVSVDIKPSSLLVPRISRYETYIGR